jgi:hypothetical protein
MARSILSNTTDPVCGMMLRKENSTMTKGLELFNGLIAANLFLFLDVPAGAVTSGRARALATVALALICVVVGGIAFVRSAASPGKVGAAIALILGVIVIVLSVVHIAGSTGFGSGGGRAGAIVALVLSIIGMILGGLAIARTRRATAS